MHLIGKSPRSVGVSPLAVFFDVTDTTDSGLINGNATPTQDVTYTWIFGDGGASGTGTWLNGSNPGQNSKNTATGPTALHLFNILDGSGDTSFITTVVATDGVNTASCTFTTTVYDASGSNGFPTTATTCLFNSSVGSNCPAGATQTTASTFNAVGATLTGKRLLYKCGDTFTGNSKLAAGTKWRVGAYGTCPGTLTNRPIFSLGSGDGMSAAFTASDGAFSDIDMEGSGVSGGGTAFPPTGSGGGTDIYPSQITLYNVRVHDVRNSYWSYGGHEIALVQFVQANMGNTDGSFINLSENQCLNGSAAYNCGLGGTSYVPARYASVDYLGLLGSLFDGTGATSGGPWEVVRISAGRKVVIENSTFQNGLNGGAVLKLHDGNSGSVANAPWLGQAQEFSEISDNLFTGITGAQIVELTPQNGVTDERSANMVFERNMIFQSINDGVHGCRIWATVQNGTFRNNVFSTPNGNGNNFCLELGNRGIAGHGPGGSPQFPNWPQYNEVYNNTCYGGPCIGLSGATWGAPANNSIVMNNLYYRASGGTTITNTGTGNTVSNNTTTVTNNPAITNGSGLFNTIPDFKPTANYTGGIAVQQPIFFDGLNVPITPTYDLGAVKH